MYNCRMVNCIGKEGGNRLMCTEVFYKDLKIFLEDDVMVIQPMTDTNLEVRDIMNIRKIALEICGKEKQLILTDTRGQYLGISNRARKFMSRSSGKTDIRWAEAYVADSLPMKIIVNHYANSDQPPNPVNVFDSKEAAKQWLLEMNEN